MNVGRLDGPGYPLVYEGLGLEDLLHLRVVDMVVTGIVLLKVLAPSEHVGERGHYCTTVLKFIGGLQAHAPEVVVMMMSIGTVVYCPDIDGYHPVVVDAVGIASYCSLNAASSQTLIRPSSIITTQ